MCVWRFIGLQTGLLTFSLKSGLCSINLKADIDGGLQLFQMMTIAWFSCVQPIIWDSWGWASDCGPNGHPIGANVSKTVIYVFFKGSCQLFHMQLLSESCWFSSWFCHLCTECESVGRLLKLLQSWKLCYRDNAAHWLIWLHYIRQKCNFDKDQSRLCTIWVQRSLIMFLWPNLDLISHERLRRCFSQHQRNI